MHPNTPSYDELLNIRDELRMTEDVDARKLKAIEIQIARVEKEQEE